MIIKKQKFEPMLSEAALAVTCHNPASAAALNTGSNGGSVVKMSGDMFGGIEDLAQLGFTIHWEWQCSKNSFPIRL